MKVPVLITKVFNFPFTYNSGHLEKDDPILTEGKKALVTVDEMDNAIEALNSALENPTVAALSKAIANGQRLQNQYGKFSASCAGLLPEEPWEWPLRDHHGQMGGPYQDARNFRKTE